MTSETTKIRAKLAKLSASLDDLEEHLAPLFTQSLPESIVALDPIQQAKLQTILPYVAYDLIFVYLKTRGIDPKTHPVVPELDRVRQYFEKIANAENPASKRTAVDKAAAGRFIKHAITQAKNTHAISTTNPDEDNNDSVAPGPSVQPKITSKMVERAQYEKKLKEREERQSDEEEDLEVFDDGPPDTSTAMEEDDDEEEDDDNTPPANQERVSIGSQGKGKGKARIIATEDADAELPTSKRRRPAVDPFAGYGDDAESMSMDAEHPLHLEPEDLKDRLKTRTVDRPASSLENPEAAAPPSGNSSSPRLKSKTPTRRGSRGSRKNRKSSS